MAPGSGLVRADLPGLVLQALHLLGCRNTAPTSRTHAARLCRFPHPPPPAVLEPSTEEGLQALCCERTCPSYLDAVNSETLFEQQPHFNNTPFARRSRQPRSLTRTLWWQCSAHAALAAVQCCIFPVNWQFWGSPNLPSFYSQHLQQHMQPDDLLQR